MRANKGISIFKKVKFLGLALLFSINFNVLASSPEHEHGTETVSAHVEDTAHHAAAAHGEDYNAEEVIMHHLGDAHDWHFISFGHTHVSIPLPVIIYSKEKGLDIFLSNKFKSIGDDHGHGPKYHNGYVLFGEKIYIGPEGVVPVLDKEGNVENLTSVTDFSLTKNVASMIVAFTIMALVFISVAKAYAKRGNSAPKGLQSFMEPLIMFVRDDIARPNLGAKTDRFLPYLLTVFFFIWVNNLLGLLPGAANVTGNIAVTAVLALITLILTLVNAKGPYWGHIFNPPGVPKWLFPIMIPVEIVGVFTKPFALMIRLFANITAGHVLILSVIGLIFMFSKGGTAVGAGFGVSTGAIPLAIFLYLIELLVAFLQAFIFTMLTSLFIGQAIDDHGHGDEHAHDNAHH